MTRTPETIPAHMLELLDDAALSLHQLAQASAVSPDWISARVAAGVLTPAQGQDASGWRFACASVQRVRRIVQLERTYDADPQLAALAADLMEEVARLRQQLRRLQG